MKFSIKDFFSKYDQVRGTLRICLYLLKKSLMEKFTLCAVLLLIMTALKYNSNLKIYIGKVNQNACKITLLLESAVCMLCSLVSK